MSFILPSHPPKDGVFIPGHGPDRTRYMVVGEGPGKDEHENGLPFFDNRWYGENYSHPLKFRRGGASGRELTRLLKMAGLERGNVRITNLTRYFDPTGDISLRDIKRDEPHLIKELHSVRPEYVMAVGRYSTRWFLGDVDMDQVHGIPHEIRTHGWEGVVIPCIHPAAGLYSPEVQPRIAYDFQQAGLCIAGKIPSHRPKDEHPFAQYKEIADSDGLLFTNEPRVVAIDSEGWTKRIWSIQFTTEAGKGYVIRPQSKRAMATFLWWLAQTKPLMLFHNSLHDLDIMRELGLDVGLLRLPFIDTMVWAYQLQVEPQGLKPLAYRFCGMEMDDYIDLVGPASYKYALDYIIQVAGREWPKPEPEVIRDGIDVRVYTPQPAHTWAKKVLADIASGKLNKDGEPTDPRARWRQASTQTHRMVTDALGPMPEATLDDVPLPNAVRYGGMDADATFRLYPHLRRRILAMGLSATSNIDHSVIPMVERMQHRGMPYDRQYFRDLAGEMESAMDKTVYDLSKECGHRINPNSPDQVAAILYGGDLKQKGKVVAEIKGRGFEIIKRSRKTGKPVTNKKVVEALRTTDKAADLIIQYREQSKVKDSFALPLSLIESDDDRCRCTIRITRVVSGRLSATDPPLLAIPVRTDLGLKVRRGFKASICPKCGQRRRLATWDLDQIEMRVMAHESQDRTLLDLFNDPRKDVHYETAAEMFRIRGATYLNKYAGVDKVKHRMPAKRVGFGVITGIQGPGLLDQMRQAGIEGWTLEECERIIARWFEIYPGVNRYMQQCRLEAEVDGFVRESFGGRIRYLPGAASPLTHIREEALRQSHSHKISAGAQSILKKSMAVIWDRMPEVWEAWGGPDGDTPGCCEWLLQVHDEILGEFHSCDDQATLESVMDGIVVDALVNTTKLSVPLGAKGGFGEDWAALEK
jgi:uracil-DNA glycosylase family 4